MGSSRQIDARPALSACRAVIYTREAIRPSGVVSGPTVLQVQGLAKQVLGQGRVVELAATARFLLETGKLESPFTLLDGRQWK